MSPRAVLSFFFLVGRGSRFSTEEQSVSSTNFSMIEHEFGETSKIPKSQVDKLVSEGEIKTQGVLAITISPAKFTQSAEDARSKGRTVDAKSCYSCSCLSSNYSSLKSPARYYRRSHSVDSLFGPYCVAIRDNILCRSVRRKLAGLVLEV